MIIDPKIRNYYSQKAKSSFKARFDLLLFERIVHEPQRLADISESDFDEFLIKEHEISLREYIHEYWQAESVNEHTINGHSIQDIYLKMNDWLATNKALYTSLLSHYETHTYKEVFPEEKFVRMIKEGHECHYCHTSITQIKALIHDNQLSKKHITRGWTLEIDRKIPFLEYTPENCVICCYWCNNAKTDEFTYEEFKKVGFVIESIWHDRLKKKEKLHS
jgi:5-methylcytosine-specific restriction endonuclease McrA